MDERQEEPGADQHRQFEAIATFTRELVPTTAEVDVTRADDQLVAYCAVTPRDPSACGMWIMSGEMLTLSIGDGGCEWLYSRSNESSADAQRLIEAVVAGRVSERTAFGRACIYVDFENGQTDSSTAYNGCLSLLVPQPGWKTRRPLRTFAPYGRQG